MSRFAWFVHRLWHWLVRLLRRLLGLPAPGARLVEGSAGAPDGAVAGAFLAAPRRDYLLRVPAGYRADRARPLLVWIHGCKQSPEDFLALSGVGARADAGQCLVLAPRQSRLANPLRCWNWFDPATARGAGEAAIVAAQIDAVCRDWQVDPDRVYVCGLSSGGAMAAVLAVRMPRRFAGAAIVAGISCAAASSALTAQHVLDHGPQGDPARVGRLARQAAGGQCRLPVLVVQGQDDTAVPPLHALALVRQMLALNGDSDRDGGSGPAVPAPSATTSSAAVPGFPVRIDDYQVDGRLAVRVMNIGGLGHAWSGAQPGPRFGEPAGPDATAAIMDFFGLKGPG